MECGRLFYSWLCLCYWMCQSDVSVIPFTMCLFFIVDFGLVVMNNYIFSLSLPVGDKVF